MSFVEQFLHEDVEQYDDGISVRRQSIYDHVINLPKDKCFPAGWLDGELREEMGFVPEFDWVSVIDPRPRGTESFDIAVAVSPLHDEDNSEWLVTLVGKKNEDWVEIGSLFLVNHHPFISIESPGTPSQTPSYPTWESVDSEIFLTLAETGLGLTE